ncbi:MAG: hypothetical protein AMXMBFR34_33800 [Myxococcaceae bacterium]
MGSTALLVVMLLAGDAPMTAPVERAMQANLAQVASILAFLESPDAFRDPKNAAPISEAIDVLARMEHVVRQQDNPAVSTIGSLFGQEVARTRADFDQGRPDSARHRMIGLTRMCMGCHSSAAVNLDFRGLDGLVDSLRLSPLQRANFYVATHQFSRAKELWTKALSITPTNDAETFEQAQALRLAVATLTRTQQDPDAVLEVVAPQLKRRDYPGFMQRALKRWVADASAWRAEGFDPSRKTPEALLAKAEALLAKTGAASRMLSDDEGLVLNMRAAAYVTRALDGNPPPAREARGLYLLALAHTTSVEPALWQLDGLLLERCVQLQPHTEQAQVCAKRLADRVGFSYHGSEGGPVPAAMVQRIGELRALAMP